MRAKLEAQMIEDHNLLLYDISFPLYLGLRRRKQRQAGNHLHIFFVLLVPSHHEKAFLMTQHDVPTSWAYEPSCPSCL